MRSTSGNEGKRDLVWGREGLEWGRGVAGCKRECVPLLSTLSPPPRHRHTNILNSVLCSNQPWIIWG